MSSVAVHLNEFMLILLAILNYKKYFPTGLFLLFFRAVFLQRRSRELLDNDELQVKWMFSTRSR